MDKLGTLLADIQAGLATIQDDVLNVAARASDGVWRYSAAIERLLRAKQRMRALASLMEEADGLLALARDAHQGQSGDVIPIRPLRRVQESGIDPKGAA